MLDWALMRRPAALLSVAFGILIGLGTFTFVYARGASYLTNDPAACANCHVMRDQYAGWMKASHRKAAVCNDCHAPHDVVGKYATKAFNGFMHSWAFTTGRFPDWIQITSRNRRVTDATCLHCHSEIVAGLEQSRIHKGGISCLNCHRDVGHKH